MCCQSPVYFFGRFRANFTLLVYHGLMDRVALSMLLYVNGCNKCLRIVLGWLRTGPVAERYGLDSELCDSGRAGECLFVEQLQLFKDSAELNCT